MEFAIFFGMGFLGVAVLTWLAQSYCLWRWGATPGKYFFKLMSTPLFKYYSQPFFNAAQIQILINSYEWIFIERRDLFEQFLSLIISLETDVYYTEQGIRMDEKAIFSRSEMRQIALEGILNYFVLKQLIQPRCILYYEDHTETNDPLQVLQFLGLPCKGFDPKGIFTHSMQNIGDKLRYFKNQIEIIEDYKASALEKIFPCPR
jgi:hypothetical protein